MGQRTAIVTTELKDRLYDAAAREGKIAVLDATPNGGTTVKVVNNECVPDEELWNVTLVGDAVGEGQFGHVQVICKQDGSLSFKPYVTDFWEN